MQWAKRRERVGYSPQLTELTPEIKRCVLVVWAIKQNVFHFCTRKRICSNDGNWRQKGSSILSMLNAHPLGRRSKVKNNLKTIKINSNSVWKFITRLPRLIDMIIKCLIAWWYTYGWPQPFRCLVFFLSLSLVWLGFGWTWTNSNQ